MKAFVSYSINDTDQYLLTLLSSKLRERFVVNTSQNFYSNVLDFSTQNEIGDSHLFVGIITGQGLERNRVLDEWRFATTRNIPALLLIEDTVQISQTFRGDYIRFNRFNPQAAINEIHRRMEPQTTTTTTTRANNSDDILPWILGGVALIAILAVLSSNKKS